MVQVPRIERLAGIECYCTDFAGVGGSIKQAHGGFRVSEVVAESLTRNRSDSYDEQHRYPLYILEKQGLDSNHALMEIAQKFHIRLRVMGIKDAKAVTVQYAGAERQSKDPPPELRTAHCTLYLKGFTKRPLDKEFLAGNKFEITVYGAKTLEVEGFVPEIRRIGNFYGLQRFGSERLVTHLIGREIIRRDFDKAVELLLSYTTEYDSAQSRELRDKSSDPANYARLAGRLPRGMDIERKVMSAIAGGKDSISALRTIPITIRRLYVQAYQAFIFNRCLSRAVAAGQDLLAAEPGDLCFEMEDPTTFGRIIKFENAERSRLTVPAIRMAGFTFQAGSGARFDRITRAILEEEGVAPRDFYIKEMQELSQQGGFRQAPLWCTCFSHQISNNNDNNNNNKSQHRLAVSFQLPKGSYATTLLREMLKPEDPIASGF